MSDFYKMSNERELYRDQLFMAGLMAFWNICKHNPELWTVAMLEENADQAAVREFMRAGGYVHMTPSEIEEAEAGIVGEWAARLLARFEAEQVLPIR